MLLLLFAALGLAILVGILLNTWFNNTLTQKVYGQFSSSVTQAVGADNVVNIQYDTTEVSKGGISYDVGTPSQIVIPKTATYKFAWSIQLDKSSGGTTEATMYISVNGMPVPRSAGKTVVVGQTGETLPYTEYILSLNKNDTVEVILYSTDTAMAATAYVGSGSVPATPSIITTIIEID